jgi:hypothetical protein
LWSPREFPETVVPKEGAWVKDRSMDRNGEALAARVNDEIERLELGGIFAAEYVPEKERVRVRRFDRDRDDAEEAVDYPVWFPWSERAIEDLRVFARLRGKR